MLPGVKQGPHRPRQQSGGRVPVPTEHATRGKTEQDTDASPGELMTATMEDGTHITITHARDRDTNALSLVVQCVGVEGDAEALCQDIARRYRKQ